MGKGSEPEKSTSQHLITEMYQRTKAKQKISLHMNQKNFLSFLFNFHGHKNDLCSSKNMNCLSSYLFICTAAQGKYHFNIKYIKLQEIG